MPTHIVLVCKQPKPVLFIDRHLQLDRTVLVCTACTQTVADRLTRLITNCEVTLHAEPYELNQVVKLLNDRSNLGDNVVANLTGGAKIMMLAAFAHAMQRKQCFVYLESERPPQRLHRFTVRPDDVGDQIDIDLIIRHDNQVAIGEVTGSEARRLVADVKGVLVR